MKRRFVLYTVLIASFFAMRIAFSKGQEGAILSKKRHIKNITVFNDLIERTLANHSPEWLSEHINELGQEAISCGFDPSVYSYRHFGKSGYLTFTSTPIWEGEADEVDLTFFVLAWPPEEHALSFGSEKPNCYYASNIHSHPISCAFTVLDGAITQHSFSSDENGVVSTEEDEVFHKGEGAFDDQGSPFIHQMLSQESGDSPTITLHAYGAKSAKEVKSAFDLHAQECSFLEVFQEDGSYTTRLW